MRAVLLLAALLALAACEREKRDLEARGTGFHGDNAYEIGQGKRLFVWMNCNGCHASGGGSYGPPLMDAGWRYGAQPEEIFATIMDGRPNGMPSFRGKVTEQQAWQLVAYVRSLSGNAPAAALPGRSDGLSPGEPAQRRDRLAPREEHPPEPKK